MSKKTTESDTPRRDRDFFESLSESELDQLWANRAEQGIEGAEEQLLRFVLRERKGFKPVERFVSICQRCNLPADNCACLNT
jgi:hypothetical protein